MSTRISDSIDRATFVLASALLMVLIWYLFDVILIVIGATLVAVLLRLGSEPFIRHLRLPRSIALTFSGLIAIGLVSTAAYLFGTQINAEMQEVVQRASEAQKIIVANLGQSRFGTMILTDLGAAKLSIPDVLSGIFTVSANFIEAFVIAVIAGIYLAVQPSLYRTGLTMLFPPRWRANAGDTIDDIGNALRLWVIGQLIQMLFIAVISTLATWLIGLPSPLALGLIAGILEFIPYLGPIIAAIPALLVAATRDMNTILWTALAYILIHQAEGNFLVPIIQRRMVFIPPAVILLGIIAISFLFGNVALIFAAPLTVVIFVLVKKVYIRDSLGERTSIPGETT